MKLGTNVTSFFEKTTEMLERMSVVLPQYAAHLSVCLNRQSVDNTRLVRSLFLVYMDIIDFCKHLCAILSRGHAGMSHDLIAHGQPSEIDIASVWKRAGFWGSVTWKPFHVRFEQLLARMTDHERIFRAELDISDGKMLNRIVDSQRQLSGLYSALQEKLNTHLTADSRIHGNTQAGQCTIISPAPYSVLTASKSNN